MAIEPAAISARPATTTRRLLSMAPEMPAARAKGTVRPSDIPITTSRTTSPAVKCFSRCGVCGMASQLGMTGEVVQGPSRHFALALIAELLRRFFQREPEGALYLDPHGVGDVAQPSRTIQQQEKAHDLEDPGTVAPAANIDVLDIGEFTDQLGAHTGFFAYIAKSGV